MDHVYRWFLSDQGKKIILKGWTDGGLLRSFDESFQQEAIKERKRLFAKSVEDEDEDDGDDGDDDDDNDDDDDDDSDEDEEEKDDGGEKEKTFFLQKIERGGSGPYKE